MDFKESLLIMEIKMVMKKQKFNVISKNLT